MMFKKIISLLVVLGLFAATGSIAAGVQLQADILSTPGVDRTLTLPAAADNSPVISLGQTVDPGTGQIVEGYAFVHYKNEKAKGGNKGRPPKDGGGDVCYSFLASGAKWKVAEPWVVNPSNTEGLDESFVFNNLKEDIAKWEHEAGVNILGDGSVVSYILEADSVTPDGVNEVYFGDINSPGAIGEAGMMDFENIATHELGHTVGMGHPNDSCVEETMFRFADYGETKKDTLEAGDIAGIKALY
jgi:hypothetical protein